MKHTGTPADAHVTHDAMRITARHRTAKAAGSADDSLHARHVHAATPIKCGHSAVRTLILR